MSSIPASPATQPRTAVPRRDTAPVAILAALLLLVIGWGTWLAIRGPVLPGAPTSADVIEAQYGIRITHIAVLADGGLIDFRFQIVDADKAAPLFNLDTRPILIVEKTGQVVGSLYHPPHSHDIVAGQSTYFLYNDTGGVIRSGTAVSVLVGNLRLEHIIAQ